MVNGSDKRWLLLSNSGRCCLVVGLAVEVQQPIDLNRFGPKEKFYFQYMERDLLFTLDAAVIHCSLWHCETNPRHGEMVLL